MIWQSKLCQVAGLAKLCSLFTSQTTGAWPRHRYISRPDLRPPEITTNGELEGSPGYYFLGIAAEIRFKLENSYNEDYVVIVDQHGEYVYIGAGYTTPLDFRKQVWNGKEVMTFWTGTLRITANGAVAADAADSQSDYVMLDQNYRPIMKISPPSPELFMDTHDLLFDGNEAILVLVETLSSDLTSLGGHVDGLIYANTIRRVDLITGEVLFEWRSVDHVGLDESYYRLQFTAGDVALPYDYFHFNSLEVDPADGNYIISSRHTATVYKINSSTGEIIWRLGGKRNDFILGEGCKFSAQHDARLLSATEMSLFDNQAGDDPLSGPWEPRDVTDEESEDASNASRGIVLELDFEKMTCALKSEFKHYSNPKAFVMGNMQQLPNGNFLLGYGEVPLVAEYAPNGTLLFEMYHGYKGLDMSYRALKFNWTSIPDSLPDLATKDKAVYMSWNGATEVKYWNILIGDPGQELSNVATVMRTGFETSHNLAKLWPKYECREVQVEALSQSNQTLAHSSRIQIGLCPGIPRSTGLVQAVLDLANLIYV